MSSPTQVTAKCTGEMLELFGGCIPFNGAVMAGVLGLVGVILSALVTLWVSRGNRKTLSLAALKRELFDARAQRRKERHDLKIERERSLIKHRESVRADNRKRLEQASIELRKSVEGTIALIEEGPVFGDLRMIKETARVLDVFGDFQTTVGHYAIPPKISVATTELISHLTRILLTLSPQQEVRSDPIRIALLAPLKDKLNVQFDGFLTLCRAFDNDPDSFTIVP